MARPLAPINTPEPDDSHLDVDLRKLVHEEMVRQGYSVHSLAVVAGVADQQLSRWLRGDRDILSRPLSKILQALGVRIT